MSPLLHAVTLVVFAAASLTDAFQELGRVFEQRHPGVTVQFNFAGSQQLAAQLDQGAAADVFASADERWMSHAQAGGLVAGAPTVFAQNRLVVIVPVGNPARIDRLADLARPGIKLVVGASAVPAGRYTRQAFGRIAAAPGIPPDYERRVLANVVSEEENVKAVVAKVQLGEADAGVVYGSDVTAAVAPRVRVLEIPGPQNVIASYPIAILAGAGHPSLAREFTALVTSAAGQDVLRRHGLLPPVQP